MGRLVWFYKALACATVRKAFFFSGEILGETGTETHREARFYFGEPIEGLSDGRWYKGQIFEINADDIITTYTVAWADGDFSTCSVLKAKELRKLTLGEAAGRKTFSSPRTSILAGYGDIVKQRKTKLDL